MKFLKIIGLLFLITSCASIRVNPDFDSTTDFKKYKTYNYYSDIETGLSELDTKRLLNAIDSNMVAKGFSLSDTPDFFIDVKSTEFQTENRSAIGLGGGGGVVGGGISIGLPIGQANLNREITLKFIDKVNNQLFWQAVSKSKYKPNELPEKREARINAVVAKILLEYPPEK